MKRIFMFDIDGTLTPPRLPMTEEMVEMFKGFCERNRVILVTGSDMSKVVEQVPKEIRDLVEGIYTCSGNAYTVGDNIIYENEFRPPEELIALLEDWKNYSHYPVKTGEHLEYRDGMLNYSTVGRNCTQQEREDYEVWDDKNGERAILRERILNMFPSLDCAIGGQISIDIYPRGLDKSQSYFRVKGANPDHAIIFCGDRLMPGGNDYPFFKAMGENQTGCRPLDIAVPVSSWQDTKRFLVISEKNS
jgi:phosphomannomutase